MKSTKKPVKTIREPKRQPGYFELEFNGKTVSHLSKQDFLDKYFIGLEKNLKEDTDLEKLIKQYESVWKKSGKVRYIDSWGHIWDQGVSHKVMLDYLTNKQNELTNKI